MLDHKSFTNYLDLCWLKANNLIDNPYFDFILNDDIRCNDLLLLRKGNYIDKIIIDKLLKFGIREVKVELAKKHSIDNDVIEIDSIKNQSALIIEDSIKKISLVARDLLKAGFDGKNIFAITDLSQLSKYLKNKHLSYIFIDYNLYNNKILKIIENTIPQRIINIFLLNAPDSIKLPKFPYISIKPVSVSLNSIYIKTLISHCKAKNLNCNEENDFEPIKALSISA